MVGGANAADFSVTIQPTSPVAASGNTTFTVHFDPSAVGLRSATFSIANDDADENPYDFSIQGTGTGAAEMDVSGNAVSIADGDGTPSLSDHTDFGSADITSGTVDRVFTVANLGNTNLNLTGTPKVVVGGANAADFSVTVQPSSPVAASGNTTFTVRFDPSAVGLRSATFSIANDDADENPYDFSIQGTGTGAAEMDVSGNSVSITDGDGTPSLTDHTDFGSADISSGAVDRVFTVSNLGNTSLNLTGTPKVVVGGTNAADFSVTVQPTSLVAPSGNTTFTVRFDPSAVGLRSATLSIANDDADENPYDFSIQGTGTAPAATADVSGDASICDGGSTTIQAALTGTAPWNLTWSDGFVQNGVTTSPAARTVSPTSTTVYTVTSLSDANGSGTSSGSATVTVNPNPVVAVADALTCAGGSATISAGVTSGTAPFSYAWTVPGGASNPGNAASFSATVAGTYSVVVTDMHGCTGTDAGTLSVNANPVVTVADVSACSGNSATISAGVTGGAAPFSYAWTVPGGASNPGDVASFSATVAGNYAVVVTDVHGCTGAGNGDLTVDPGPTADAGADATVLSGASAIIGGAPTASGGTGVLTISWSPAAGLYDDTAANPTAAPTATTTYTVTVTDENGCESSDDVVVTVTSFADYIAAQCAAIQAMLDDPGTPEDAIEFLEDAQDACGDAQQAAIDDDVEELFDLMRDVADALEEARDENADTDAIASQFADLARHIALEKKDEALACDPTPSGKMADDIEDGDNDLADGDDEYDDGYFGDAIKDYKKAWEDYCDALDRCASPKAAVVNRESAIENTLPAEFALHQNYPNPFNPTTTIQFDLIEAGNVELRIYNGVGQLVRTLVSGDYAPGAHKVTWDARDNDGVRVASGLYLYTIKAGQQFTAQRKLLLMK